ncbi:GtrA family protein [Pseudarthrobacter oxydans]|uniref:GtrA family protein n=1 Tax=Pseudarthrobacter oxydans TaxID=1671 RepID=UPI003436AECC
MTRLIGLLNCRLSRYAVIGAGGAVLNILIMMALIGTGAHYVTAAVIAAEITIITNFILQERLAFADLTEGKRPFIYRFLQSFTFNTLEAMARVPFLWLLVEYLHVHSLAAQAGTICVAFFSRYAFHLKFVYAQQDQLPVSQRLHQWVTVRGIFSRGRGAPSIRDPRPKPVGGSSSRPAGLQEAGNDEDQ